MEKKEAAEFLGVSMRTLERLAASGRLTKGRARKKTRPVVVFDPHQLAELKKALSSKTTAQELSPESFQRPLDGVGFRLDPYYLKRLGEEGERHGMSAGEYARRLVIQGLESDFAAMFAQEVRGLRGNLAEVFYLILTGKMGASEEEGEQIVRALAGEA